MYVLILPVSGGGFVSQLAILQHLCEVNFIPDVTMASSGGNVAAYVASAAQWKWAGIERIGSELNHNLFVRPWSSIGPVSYAMGYFNGNIYDRGTGANDFICKYFDEKSVTKDEIWTGTFNKNKKRARLFCNRNKEEAILDIAHVDHDLTRSMESCFACGDLKLIAEASIASASIPGVVPSQKIHDEDYIDGGVARASPLRIMQEPILKYVATKQCPLHLIYVNCMDLSYTEQQSARNILDTWKQAASDLMTFQNAIDRQSAYDLLRCHPGSVNKKEFDCNFDNLVRLQQIQMKTNYTLVEFYPTDDYDINITNFSGADVVNNIRRAYPNCKCRLWWLTPNSVTNLSEIHEILEKCI